MKIKETTKEKTLSLEDQLKSIQKIYDDDCIAKLILKKDGSIILGAVSSVKAMKYEEDLSGDDGDDDDHLEHQDKVNPLSMGEVTRSYIG